MRLEVGLLKFLAAVFLAVFFSGCATGPSLREQSAALPVLESGKARIFFYRAGVIGGAYQPDVLLNGQKVGSATPRGVFFRDVTPGKYAVTTTMTTQTVNFVVSAGEKRYVRLSYSFGFNIYPELVDNATGESESVELSYTGSK